MLRKITNWLQNYFLPRFSELEFLTFFYLLLLALLPQLIEHRVNIVGYPEQIISVAREDITVLFAFVPLILLVLFFVGWIIRLVQLSLTQKTLHYKEKEYYSELFYLLVAYVGFLASLSFIQISKDFSGLVNNFFVYLVIFRSAGTVLILSLLKDDKHNYIYSSRMTDEQVSRFELIIMLIASTAIFIYERQYYGFTASITLSYFYTTSLVLLLRNLRNRRVGPETV